MIGRVPDRRVAWLVFALVSITSWGNYYVLDSIAPVADLLQRQRAFTSTQIGMLNAICSMPNIVVLILGGLLLDRFGPARVTLWTAALCLAGAALTAFGDGFVTMAAGRLLFGIGSETLLMGVLVAVVKYFSGGSLAFATGLSVAMGRLGSFSADISPTVFADAYHRGWQPPLVIAAVVAAMSFAAACAFWLTDRWAGKTLVAARPARAFRLTDMFRFGRAYWLLAGVSALWYSVMSAFRSTYAIIYFQHARHLDLAMAGAMNSCVYLAAFFATPAFGWLCDRVGRYAPLMTCGTLLLPVAIAILALTGLSPWVATALIGISYSVVPAVMWPLASRLVPPERFGTALGLMWVVQNAGISTTNLVAGALNDAARASAHNPAGYQPMMAFFGTLSMFGFGCALLLWITAGRRRQETAMHGRPTPNADIPDLHL